MFYRKKNENNSQVIRNQSIRTTIENLRIFHPRSATECVEILAWIDSFIDSLKKMISLRHKKTQNHFSLSRRSKLNQLPALTQLADKQISSTWITFSIHRTKYVWMNLKKNKFYTLCCFLWLNSRTTKVVNRLRTRSDIAIVNNPMSMFVCFDILSFSNAQVPERKKVFKIRYFLQYIMHVEKDMCRKAAGIVTSPIDKNLTCQKSIISTK